MKHIVVIEKIGDCETDITKAEYDRLLAVEKQRNEMLALLEEFVQVQPLVCDDTCDCRRSRAKRLISRAKGDG